MNDAIKTDKSAIQEDLNEEYTKDEGSKELKPSTIHVKFKTGGDQVKFVLQATNEQNIVIAANRKLQLIQGRTYYVPVDTDVNSDEYGNMKIYSDISEKIDVRYVKDGIACVYPLKHNIFIEDKQQLCVLW